MTTLALSGLFLQLGRLIGVSSGSRAAPPVRLSSPEYRKTADAILAASDLAELHELLDEFAVTHDPFESVRRLLREQADERETATKTSEASSEALADFKVLLDEWKLEVDSLSAVLGAPCAQNCVEGHTALKEFLSGFVALACGVASLPPEQRPFGAVEPDPDAELPELTRLIYDIALPLGARRFVLGYLRSFAAAVAIARAEEHGKPIERWLALAITEQFRDGLVGGLASWKSFWESVREGDPKFLASVSERKSLTNFVDHVYESARLAS